MHELLLYRLSILDKFTISGYRPSIEGMLSRTMKGIFSPFGNALQKEVLEMASTRLLSVHFAQSAVVLW